ncbi:MAG: nucleotidyltransferase domain-containing protein [Terriglobia bacterium]|jgi:predicted nucleotidyltransferase
MTTEEQLTQLVSKLKKAAESNLLSVILYGSAATDEFHPEHSDLNVLCILRGQSSRELSKLGAASTWWAKKGHPAPLFFTPEELQHSADIFAIELLDIKAARRILYGEDVIAALDVPTERHRMQVEREFRNNALRLRQHYVMLAGDSRKTLELMLSSISTFAALFRHALLALGEEPPSTKRATLDRAGSALGFDPSPFHTLLDIREGRKRRNEVDVQATFDKYLHAVVKATEEVDRRLASGGTT